MTNKKHQKLAKAQQQAAQAQERWVLEHQREVNKLVQEVSTRHRINHYHETFAKVLSHDDEP